MNLKKKSAFFDVGANFGTNSLQEAKSRPDVDFFAFEPTPFLVDHLIAQSRHLKNYHVVPCAVSNVEGEAEFNIAGQNDWGCSSLNHFNDNVHVTWKGYTDLCVTETVKVKVIRLDKFIEENEIEDIVFYHCDVQGKDLESLMGMGDHIKKIQQGVIEMPTSHEVKLYKDQNYIVADAVTFLEDKGFHITKLESNDAFNNEMNILFERKRNN